jgi:hypothetical protein
MWFDGLMNPSQDDNARFDRAKQQEAIRMSEIEGRRLFEEDVQLEMGMKEIDHLLGLDSEMETQEVPTDDEPQQRAPKKPNSKPKPKQAEKAEKAQMSKKEINRASDIGLRHLLDKHAEQQSQNSNAKKGLKGILQHTTEKAPKKTPKKTTRLSNFDIEGLFHHDIVASANVNASMAELPGSDKKDKSKALAEIIASLPISDQGEAKSDKKRCIEASKAFKPPAKLVEKAWKIKGLETHLYHYQVSNHQPRIRACG